MAKRRIAYRRRRHQNRFSMFLVSLVVLMIMVVVAVRSVELQRKIDGYDMQIAGLNAQIEAENPGRNRSRSIVSTHRPRLMWRK